MNAYNKGYEDELEDAYKKIDEIIKTLQDSVDEDVKETYE